jgi:hypothetical protein
LRPYIEVIRNCFYSNMITRKWLALFAP